MAPASLEGQTLGKYRVLEPLGRGGMAQVYKAYHPQLDRYVAVKVLRSDLVEDQEFLARFRREARAVAALRHPNIIQVYDFDVHDDWYFMVMELLEGDSLKAYLNAFRTRRERMPLGDVVRILNDVLTGLAYAHSEGIIHRDLKPGNIMLTRRGQAVLTDFGIAQILGGTQYTVSGALMGTLNYMAPEQGRDGKCDVRSDIYSLGIAYYETLTGTVPFDADTPLAILMKHLNDPLPMPRAFDPTIPEPFERVALKALAKDPRDRFQTAMEMLEGLNSAAQEAGVELPETVTLPQRMPILPVRPGPVAVFSGEARMDIQDPGFAKGDTDIQLGKKGALAEADEGPAQPKNVSQAVFGSIAAIIFANMIMLWASGVFGWDVFGRTWPLELIVGGSLLIALMTALAEPWLLIPGGIVVGNGFLFAYFALSGWWEHWAILWPLEPLLVGASILAPFWLTGRGLHGRRLTRQIGAVILVLAGVVFILSMGIAIILTF
ncbi:MAG: protein kinase [Chloroflexota bacterium]